MATVKTALIVFFLSIFMLACSDRADENTNEKKLADHIWKQQTDALKSAKEVAGKLEESLKQQQQKMDESH